MLPASHFSSQRRVPLKGSARKPFDVSRASEFVTQAADAEQISVSVVLTSKTPIDPNARLTREQFAERHCADKVAEEVVSRFAQEFGLSIDSPKERGRRMVQLTGSRDAMERAFGVTFQRHVTDAGTFRLREGEITLPEELSPHVVAVLGLDNRPQAKSHHRIATPRAGNVSYTPVQVAQFYGFPANASAAGQTIALLELGGGYEQADITAYFQSIGVPAPKVTAVFVDKGTNSPGDPNGADGEVMLDIEVSAGVAPGANVVVYFAPNTDQGFIDAVTTAVHDSTNKPSVLSISWGGPESTWTQQAVTALDQACQAAAAVGVTITVACGDDGSTDGVSGGGNHVDFPASSPFVLACGGTKLVASGTAVTSEVVWNDLSLNEGATGGGVSALFGLPTWQANSKVPAAPTSAGGRGVPDVAGDADPSTGYTVRVDGETTTIGGTSAVAPLWAGLMALANAANGQDVGFANPTLYGTTGAGAAGAFRDITSGNNGAFSAGPGWDACTGLGSPHGAAVIAALTSRIARGAVSVWHHESAMDARYVGRLAPSPTGLLHLGHARTFWIAAQRARAADGILWLRDEDLDPQRSRAEFAEAMREDLRWLGITWDAEMRQSERLPFYSDAMEQLVRGGFVYACQCSRKDLQQAVQAPHDDDDEPVYSGRCRPAAANTETELRAEANYRFRVLDGEVISFVDGQAGPQSFRAGCGNGVDFGDFVVWRKDGLPSYQLACVVDDAAMGVTEVVRGRDLLRSTARQIVLQRALGISTPQYFHCELMRDEGGVRLAKRHDALSLRALRQTGYTPAEVVARLKLDR